MTRFQFTAICLQNTITPSLVWDLPDFKDLVNNDNLNPDTLQEVINNNF